jgi:hypothetical protein
LQADLIRLDLCDAVALGGVVRISGEGGGQAAHYLVEELLGCVIVHIREVKYLGICLNVLERYEVLDEQNGICDLECICTSCNSARLCVQIRIVPIDLGLCA